MCGCGCVRVFGTCLCVWQAQDFLVQDVTLLFPRVKKYSSCSGTSARSHRGTQWETKRGCLLSQHSPPTQTFFNSPQTTYCLYLNPIRTWNWQHIRMKVTLQLVDRPEGGFDVWRLRNVERGIWPVFFSWMLLFPTCRPWLGYVLDRCSWSPEDEPCLFH